LLLAASGSLTRPRVELAVESPEACSLTSTGYPHKFLMSRLFQLKALGIN